MLPIILHIKKQSTGSVHNGPTSLILTPHLAAKDDIASITKVYLDSAEICCTSIYDNEEKEAQIEKLKSCNNYCFLMFLSAQLLILHKMFET